MEICTKYKREIFMGKSNNNNKQITEKSKKQSKNNALKKFWLEMSQNPIMSGVISTLVSTLILAILGGIIDLWSLPSKIEVIQESITELETNTNKKLGEIEEQASSIKNEVGNLKEDYEKLSFKIMQLDSIVYPSVYIQMEEGVTISFEKKNVDSGYHLAAPTWKSGDVIGVDKITGDVYSAEELIGKTLLIPYNQDGKEIIFCGQYNSEYHWDEECIINVYENNRLTLIMEAYYNDGERLDYSQILSAITSGEKTWIFSERVDKGNHNSGDSWIYSREDYVKQFKLEDVTISDLQQVEDFATQYCTSKLGYYYGDTSNGYFNDTTGNAYMVKFTADGMIKSFYSGNFVKGKFEDLTGNAWYISLDENNRYYHYSGHFSNNNLLYNEDAKLERNISCEFIQSVVGNRKYDFDLVWYEDIVE